MASNKTAKPRSKILTPKSAQEPGIDTSLEPEHLEEIAQPRHSWDALWKAHGAPTGEDRRRHGVRLSPEELVTKGRRIASTHVTSDLLLWCGLIHDYLDRDRGKTNVVGFSEAKFRVIIEDTRKLVDMLARHGNSSVQSKLADRGDEAKLADAVVRVREDFDELYVALEHSCSSAPPFRERLMAAFTKSNDPGALSASVGVVVAIARELFAKPTSHHTEALIEDGVTPALVDALEKAARKLAELNARVSGPRVGQAVTQADLDQQDGVCLAHMQRLYDVFGKARQKHPKVPNLVPRGTRRLFGSSVQRTKKAASRPRVAAGDLGTIKAEPKTDEPVS